MRPEDVFELELSGGTPPLVQSDLMETVALLRAAGHAIQAPASLYGRRNALVMMTGNAGLRSWPAAWRRSRALLLAAGLTALTAVGVAAATIGSGWLADPRPPVPLDLPALDEFDVMEQGTHSPTPPPAVVKDDEAEEVEDVKPRDWGVDAIEHEGGDGTDSEDGSDDDEPESGTYETDPDESDAPESGTNETDTDESDAPESDTDKSDEPDTATDESGTDEPDTDESDEPGSDSDEPDTTEFDESDSTDTTDAEVTSPTTERDGDTAIGD